MAKKAAKKKSAAAEQTLKDLVKTRTFKTRSNTVSSRVQQVIHFQHPADSDDDERAASVRSRTSLMLGALLEQLRRSAVLSDAEVDMILLRVAESD